MFEAGRRPTCQVFSAPICWGVPDLWLKTSGCIVGNLSHVWLCMIYMYEIGGTEVPSRTVCEYLHTYTCMYKRTYIHTFMHTYIHTYIRTYIHTCIDYVTLHCIALHCIALHCSTLHYITLKYITLHTYRHICLLYIYLNVYIYIYIHLCSII